MITSIVKFVNGILNLSVATVFLALPIYTAADEMSGDVNRGARYWANNCSRCHNTRLASEFRDDLWSPVVKHMRIRAGLPGHIARDIRAFLQSSNYSTRSVQTAVDSGLSGQEIYSSTCIACHGPDGAGALPGVPKLADRLAQSTDDVLLQHVINGYQSPGSTMAMPPKGGNAALSEADVKRVISHIRNQFGN